MERAPIHLQRMAFLGRATAQRVSDLVKMRPADLTDDGINLRIGKLRNKAHMVPLTKAQMTRSDRGVCAISTSLLPRPAASVAASGI